MSLLYPLINTPLPSVRGEGEVIQEINTAMCVLWSRVRIQSWRWNCGVEMKLLCDVMYKFGFHAWTTRRVLCPDQTNAALNISARLLFNHKLPHTIPHSRSHLAWHTAQPIWNGYAMQQLRHTFSIRPLRSSNLDKQKRGHIVFDSLTAMYMWYSLRNKRGAYNYWKRLSLSFKHQRLSCQPNQSTRMHKRILQRWIHKQKWFWPFPKTIDIPSLYMPPRDRFINEKIGKRSWNVKLSS